MKNPRITRSLESARMYSRYYRPSLNPFRFIPVLLAVIFSGSYRARNL